MKSIAVIEDDRQICEVIGLYFRREGAKVEFYRDGEEAMEFINSGLQGVGLILLDVMLPQIDGFTLCRRIRQVSDIPIIFITARGREEDILYGYRLGCDDYIVKPFSLSELYMKCQAMLRRAAGQVRQSIKCGEIEINPHTLQCFVGGREVELTPKAFSILHYLIVNVGRTVSRDTLLDNIWGYDYFGNDRVVDNHIRLLRRALGSAGGQIKTVVGRGYRLTE